MANDENESIKNSTNPVYVLETLYKKINEVYGILFKYGGNIIEASFNENYSDELRTYIREIFMDIANALVRGFMYPSVKAKRGATNDVILKADKYSEGIATLSDAIYILVEDDVNNSNHSSQSLSNLSLSDLVSSMFKEINEVIMNGYFSFFSNDEDMKYYIDGLANYVFTAEDYFFRYYKRHPEENLK
jgi:hypothetical protein